MSFALTSRRSVLRSSIRHARRLVDSALACESAVELRDFRAGYTVIANTPSCAGGAGGCAFR